MKALPRTQEPRNRANAPGNQSIVELLDKQVLFMKISAAFHKGSLEEHPELLEDVPEELVDELVLFMKHDEPEKRLEDKKIRKSGMEVAAR